MADRASVVVIGAGISGLTSAWWLHRAGVDVAVMERDASPGGTMQTIHENGWLVETGPNSALETTPLLSQMFEDLGISHERVYANEASNKRFILRDGTLHQLPMSPGSFLTSSLWSLKGKLRLLGEPFVGRADHEETIAEFVERRLGKELLDYGINPFVAGVYAGNPEELSVRAAFPKLYALEEKYGGLIKGMLRGRKERKHRAERSKDRAKMLSFVNGMQTFPNIIAAGLKERVRLGCEVQAVSRGENGEKGYTLFYRSKGGESGSLHADAVVAAVPSFVAASLLAPFSRSLTEGLRSIYYPPVTEVFLGFHSSQRSIPLDGFGFLVPAKEHRRILGTIWSSSLFSARAPEGHVALTTFVGGSRQPELADLKDSELQDLVTGELQSIMHITGPPVFTKIIRWTKAIPQYNLGYHEITGAIDQFELEHPGLFICSNYRGGIAVGDCVMSGEKIASRVKSYVTQRRVSTGDSLSTSGLSVS